MSKKWKSYDEAKVSEIKKLLADGPKAWIDLRNELYAKGQIMSKRTLSQYLNHLTEEGVLRKIVASIKGRRLAYEIVSEEDRALAHKARERKSYSLGFPTEDPMDPDAIEVIRESFKPSPKPTPYDHLSEKMARIKCVCLENLKSQLEMWEEMKKSEKGAERLRCWIEDAFEQLFARIRMDFNWIALLMNAEFYTSKELMEALDQLHREALEELIRVMKGIGAARS